MARGRPDAVAGTPLDRLRAGWNRELCAEHAGEIASFETARTRIADLADYRVILGRNRRDLRQLGKQALFAAGSIAVFAPIAASSATGAALRTLSGSSRLALGDALLAAIGRRFGARASVTLLTTAGAALGGIDALSTARAYFGAIEGFGVRKLRPGPGEAVLFLDGFLAQGGDRSAPWLRGIARAYPENPLYAVTWESKRLADFGLLAGRRAAKGMADFSAPLRWATLAAGLARNPWHTAMSKAKPTGLLLAELLARTENPDGFTLLGHSLGARVIYYALEALSQTGREVVCDAVLLGAAVGAGRGDSWRAASRCVRGHIYNCHSSRDAVLRHLYRAANAFVGQPAGLVPIEAGGSKIRNVDVSDLVASHGEYKAQLAAILERALVC